MKKILFMAFAMFMGSAQAGLITIDADNSDANVGDHVNVTIELENLTEEFSNFSVGFEFDSSIYEFVTGSVTSDFAFTDFSNFVFSGLDVNTADAGVGFVGFTLFEEIDFIDSTTISKVFASTKYIIAQFQLLVIGEGSSELSVGFPSLGAPVTDPQAPIPSPLTVDVANPVSVNATAVSAPATLSLFLIAGLAMFRLRRKA